MRSPTHPGLHRTVPAAGVRSCAQTGCACRAARRPSHRTDCSGCHGPDPIAGGHRTTGRSPRSPRPPEPGPGSATGKRWWPAVCESWQLRRRPAPAAAQVTNGHRRNDFLATSRRRSPLTPGSRPARLQHPHANHRDPSSRWHQGECPCSSASKNRCYYSSTLQPLRHREPP